MRRKSYNVGAVIGLIVWSLIWTYPEKDDYSHGERKRNLRKGGKDERSTSVRVDRIAKRQVLWVVV